MILFSQLTFLLFYTITASGYYEVIPSPKRKHIKRTIGMRVFKKLHQKVFTALTHSSFLEIAVQIYLRKANNTLNTLFMSIFKY